MRAFSLLIGLGLTNAVDLPQDIIGEEWVIFTNSWLLINRRLKPVSLTGSPINITILKASCDARGQDTTYPGMCECEESCCTSQAQTEEGCPVDIVIAIDMCSCNNETWHDMKGKSQIWYLSGQGNIDVSDRWRKILVTRNIGDILGVHRRLDHFGLEVGRFYFATGFYHQNLKLCHNCLNSDVNRKLGHQHWVANKA